MKKIEENDWDTEKFWVYSDPNWECQIDGKTIPLLAIIRYMDLDDFCPDCIEFPEYPIELELSCLPEKSLIHKRFFEGGDQYTDVVVYSGGIPLNMNAITKSSGEKPVDIKKSNYCIYIKELGTVIEDYILPRLGGIFGLIGFFLDKPWNMLGCTGWDLITQYTTGESAVDIALKKHKKEYKRG